MPGHRLILRPMSKPGGALPARYTHCCICACPCSVCCGFCSLLQKVDPGQVKGEDQSNRHAALELLDFRMKRLREYEACSLKRSDKRECSLRHEVAHRLLGCTALAGKEVCSADTAGEPTPAQLRQFAELQLILAWPSRCSIQSATSGCTSCNKPARSPARLSRRAALLETSGSSGPTTKLAVP